MYNACGSNELTIHSYLKKNGRLWSLTDLSLPQFILIICLFNVVINCWGYYRTVCWPYHAPIGLIFIPIYFICGAAVTVLTGFHSVRFLLKQITQIGLQNFILHIKNNCGSSSAVTLFDIFYFNKFKYTLLSFVILWYLLL